MAAPQKKPIPDIICRRFNLPDMSEMGLWLFKRLESRYPTAPDSTFSGWLRGAMESNEYHFVRTDNAVGLAQIYRLPLDPQAHLTEVFVLVKDQDALPEGAEIYRAFKRWGESMGADEIIVERQTDVPREMIREALGKVWVRETFFCKMGK